MLNGGKSVFGPYCSPFGLLAKHTEEGLDCRWKQERATAAAFPVGGTRLPAELDGAAGRPLSRVQEMTVDIGVACL